MYQLQGRYLQNQVRRRALGRRRRGPVGSDGDSMSCF